MSCSPIKMGEEEEGGLSSLQGGCCLETGWASDCLWEVVNDFFCFACIFFPSFLHLLNCMNFDLWVFSHLLFLLSLIPLWAGQRCMSEWLCGNLAAGYSQPTTSDKYNPLKRDMCGTAFISKAFQAMSVSVAATTQRMLPSVSSWQLSRSCCPAEHNPGKASSGPLTPPQLTPAMEQKKCSICSAKKSQLQCLSVNKRRVLELIPIYSCIHLICTCTEIYLQRKKMVIDSEEHFDSLIQQ